MIQSLTLTGFPIVAEHVTIRTGTERRAQRVETCVRTSEIVAQTAFVHVFTRVAIGRQLGTGSFVTTAFVAAVSVATGALAWTVTVSQ